MAIEGTKGNIALDKLALNLVNWVETGKVSISKNLPADADLVGDIDKSFQRLFGVSTQVNYSRFSKSAEGFFEARIKRTQYLLDFLMKKDPSLAGLVLKRIIDPVLKSETAVNRKGYL